VKEHEINLLLATLAVIALIGALLFLNRNEVIKAEEIKRLTEQLTDRDNETAALQAELIFRDNSIVKDTRLEFWSKVTTEEKERLMIKHLGKSEFPIKGIDLDTIYRAERN